MPRRATKDFRSFVTSPIALVTALLLVVGAALAFAWFPRESATSAQQAAAALPPLTEQQRADIEKWWALQPTVDLPIPSDGAKVLVVKFSDYMCPSCGAAHQALKPVLAKHQGHGVEFVLKHYPLEPECNIHTPGMNHYGSCEAAAAYEMAKGTPNLAKLDDWFFDNQQALTKDVVRQAAFEQAGINDFDARYDEALKAVRADVGLGALMKVNSTPTIFINGRRIPGGAQSPAVYDAIIEIELAKAK
jgi:protein-disulfide isomerase